MPTAIHAVASTHMYPQLDYPFADWLAVAEISGLHLAQANADTRLCELVAQTVQPLRERLTSVIALVAEQFNRGVKCSLKAT